MARKQQHDVDLEPTNELVTIGKSEADEDDGDDEPAVRVTPDGFVRSKRFDPVEQAEIDGDPRFEIMLDPESEKDMKDRHPVWAHVSDVTAMKGRGARVEKHGGGYRLASGVAEDAGADITWRDHVLVSFDKAKHDRREELERAANRNARAAMIRETNNKEHTIRAR